MQSAPCKSITWMLKVAANSKATLRDHHMSEAYPSTLAMSRTVGSQTLSSLTRGCEGSCKTLTKSFSATSER